jgi:hypothetical protein
VCPCLRECFLCCLLCVGGPAACIAVCPARSSWLPCGLDNFLMPNTVTVGSIDMCVCRHSWPCASGTVAWVFGSNHLARALLQLAEAVTCSLIHICAGATVKEKGLIETDHILLDHCEHAQHVNMYRYRDRTTFRNRPLLSKGCTASVTTLRPWACCPSRHVVSAALHRIACKSHKTHAVAQTAHSS